MIFKGIIKTVRQYSIASDVGIKPGDCLIKVNNKPVQDIIELSFLLSNESIKLLIEKVNGTQEIIEIKKNNNDDLGIEFESAVFDNIRNCRNNCIFCFINQMPKGMRNSLYIKDDDYRLSFLYGNFITLTNINDKDINRIIKFKLSPLYISIHTTNPSLRFQLLNNKNAKNISNQLKKLINGGIKFHAQIVVCPGYNDKDELLYTINELFTLNPNILSVGVVPVGLTKFRDKCIPIKTFTKQQARIVINEISKLQIEFRKILNSSFVYLADEFYLKAKYSFPKYKYYDEFPQYENGIGIVSSFIKEWEEIPYKYFSYIKPIRLDIICGKIASKILKYLVKKIFIKNLYIRVIPVNNYFFGDNITVTGLLTGQDIIKTLKEVSSNNSTGIILPGIALRKFDNKFLDNLTPEDISNTFGVKIKIADSAKKLREFLEAWN